MLAGRLTCGSVGYSCVPDFRHPLALLNHAVLAEKAGFDAIWVSDHFHPWSHTDAKECNSWVWLSSGLERTKKIPFASGVTCPILRYHPAIVAQAFATMEAIHGPRVILGVGTGEAINEVPLGFKWPSLRERRERLVEAVKIMRRLWTEEFVTFQGRYYFLNNANLYMKANIPIFIAGFGPKMASIAGMLADGFITVIKPLDYIKDVLFPAVRDGARSAGRSFEKITKVIELDVSYHEDYDKALASLRFWAPSLVEETFVKPIGDPRETEKLGRKLTDKELANAFLVGTSSEDHIRRIEDAFKAGFDHVYVFSSSPDEEKTIEMYRKDVLPYFKR